MHWLHNNDWIEVTLKAGAKGVNGSIQDSVTWANKKFQNHLKSFDRIRVDITYQFIEKDNLIIAGIPIGHDKTEKFTSSTDITITDDQRSMLMKNETPVGFDITGVFDFRFNSNLGSTATIFSAGILRNKLGELSDPLGCSELEIYVDLSTQVTACKGMMCGWTVTHRSQELHIFNIDVK